MNYYTKPSSLITLLLLLLVTTSITLYSCCAVRHSKALNIGTPQKIDSIEVFPKSKEFSYRMFSNMKEEAGMFESGAQQTPKTSFVRFVFVEDSANYIASIDKSKCSAFMKGDTLKINIGSSDGLTGYGVTVTCIKSNFTTRVYRFFDSAPFYQQRLHIVTEQQKLTLDKSGYALGDSVFGSIYVRQMDNEGLKSYAAGMFRTKIEAAPL